MKKDLLGNFLIKFFSKKKPRKEDEEKEKFLENLCSLLNLKIKNFLIPRNQIIAIDITFSWEELKSLITKYPYSLYPVYRGSLDHYLGYIRLKDIIRYFKEETNIWEKYLKPPLTLPENIDLFTGIKKCMKRK